MTRSLVALAALALLCLTAAAVWAQNSQTAPGVVPGQNSITGCPSATLTPCFVPFSATSPLPVSGPGVQIAAAATGTTGAVTATLAAVAAKTTYLCGFDVSATGGVAALGPIAVGTLIGGVTYTYQLFSTATGVTLSREFSPCIAGNAANTVITITTTADGTATAVDVNAHGYQL